MLKGKIKTKLQKIGRIGVLMGGVSSERKISLKSGWTVYQSLAQLGLDVVALDIRKNAKTAIRQAKIGLAFIALHGKFGEDGTIQKILQSLQIPYTGSGVIASYLCLDKLASKRVLQHSGIAVPNYYILHTRSRAVHFNKLGFSPPVVVKPASQGSSLGVSFVNRASKLKQAVNCAFSYDQSILIEQYIRGQEITVGILEERPLPVVQIVPKESFFNFQAKYEQGKSDYLIPAKLPQRYYRSAQKSALLAHQALGCRSFSRVDMILAKQGPVVLEVNSIPGLTSNSLLPLAAHAVGISFQQLCLKIICSALV